MEKQILSMFQQIIGKIEQMDENIQQTNGQIKQINGQIEPIHAKLNEHSEILKEHGVILGGLRNGQELLRAKMSELRLQNAKDSGELKEQIEDTKVDVDLLKEDNWSNKKDIRRVQQTMGMR
jgi:chromosome segregation ATPase